MSVPDFVEKMNNHIEALLARADDLGEVATEALMTAAECLDGIHKRSPLPYLDAARTISGLRNTILCAVDEYVRKAVQSAAMGVTQGVPGRGTGPS